MSIREWLDDAEAVLIGAGAGLSVAAGIDYGDEADFKSVFPVLHAQGFRARYQFIGRTGLSPAQHWAYWATHVNDVRFRERHGEVYATLKTLTEGKDTFVLTSNVDAMFERHGFDGEKLFTPQGDYALMQCKRPCQQRVWLSQPIIEQLLPSIDPVTFEVTDLSLLPKCLNCGGEVFLNVRADARFVEKPYVPQSKRFRAWVEQNAKKKLLLLEIGAGFNTPGVVRWQMEGLTAAIDHSRFIRINRDDASVPDRIAARSLSLQMDVTRSLSPRVEG